MSSKTARDWLGSKIRTSSFTRTSWSLKDLSKNPGTQDRPKYVHADSITMQVTSFTLVVSGRTFTSDEIEYNKVAKEHGFRSQEEPVNYYYYDVRDGGTGAYLRIWVTENEMIEALLR